MWLDVLFAFSAARRRWKQTSRAVVSPRFLIYDAVMARAVC